MSENDHKDLQSASRIKNILQRFFFLRKQFKITLPSNLEAFKSRAMEDGRVGKTSDLIFLLGILISRNGEPITMGEISRAMNVPLSTATRIVDWFVRNEYATRLPDPEDRRVVRITLTEQGQEIYQAINQYMLERAESVLSHFTPSEREQLASLLEKMIDVLEQKV